MTPFKISFYELSLFYSFLLNLFSKKTLICVHNLGQALNARQAKALAELGPNPPWHKKIIVRYRRTLGLLIPALFFHVIWWSLAVRHNFWRYFPDKYFLSITMLFGSLIAGK